MHSRQRLPCQIRGHWLLIPGVRETLRIKGTAVISGEESLRSQLSVDDKLPLAVIKITVIDAYVHCGKALIRSKAWHPDRYAEKGEIPSIAKLALELEQNKDLRGTPLATWEELTEVGHQHTRGHIPQH